MTLPADLPTFVDEQHWTCAKTMPEWPHEHIVRDQVDDVLFERLVVHIRTHGVEGRFYAVHGSLPQSTGKAIRTPVGCIESARDERPRLTAFVPCRTSPSACLSRITMLASGIMTQLRRTTVSAPQAAIRTLEAEAQRRGTPLATLLREAVEEKAQALRARRRPRVGVARSSDGRSAAEVTAEPVAEEPR